MHKTIYHFFKKHSTCIVLMAGLLEEMAPELIEIATTNGAFATGGGKHTRQCAADDCMLVVYADYYLTRRPIIAA